MKLPVTPMILAVALFMEQMDSTVIATSLPAIAADIGTEPIALKLALTAYLVALAIFIPISGWMADRYGARNVFRTAILVFILGSVGCAFSNSLETFVASRFFEGMGASMMTPVGRLLLVRNTPRNELVGAMAWITIPALIGPIAGPPVGGALTTFLSWHWIFWINVPIGLMGIYLAGRFLPKADVRTPRPLDAVGFVLAGIAFSGIVFGLSVASLPALPVVYGYLVGAIGLVSGILYLMHVRRTEYPLLDPRLLRHQLFRTAMIGGSFFRFGIGAMPFLMPLMLQLAFGFDPFESGLITFVSAVGALTSKFVAEKVYATWGFPRVMTTCALVGGALLAASGLFTPETPVPVIMAILLVAGLFRSIFFTGINALGYADIDDAEASQATALNSVMQQLTIALGVAIGGGILEVAASMHGGELMLGDFHIAFYVVACLSMIGAIPFMLLPATAGSEVSGHKQKRLPAE